MLRHEEGHVAADEIAIEPTIGRSDGDTGFEIDAVADAAARWRREVAVKCAKPRQDLLQHRPFLMAPELIRDFVEASFFDRCFACVQTPKGGHYRFHQPQDLTYCLSRSAFRKQLLRLPEGFADNLLRLLVERFISLRNGYRLVNAGGHYEWRTDFISGIVLGKYPI